MFGLADRAKDWSRVSGGTHGNQEQEIYAQQLGTRVSASPGSLEIQNAILESIEQTIGHGVPGGTQSTPQTTTTTTFKPKHIHHRTK